MNNRAVDKNIVVKNSNEKPKRDLESDAAENGSYQSEFAVEEYAGEYDEHEVYEGHQRNRIKLQRSRSLLEEDAYPENTLTVQEASKCLSRIGQVGNGLLYAFIQINLRNKNLTNIDEIANFKHLSLVDVSHNHLDLNGLDALRSLTHLVSVRANHNVVNSLCLTPMPYLQVLTLNSNRVSSLSGLQQPSLECLKLNDNKINRLFQEPSKNFNSNYYNKIDCPNLVTLTLSRNSLETAEFEQLASVSVKLRVLYLSYNKIESLKGLDMLPNLRRLHLRANHISNLDGITNKLKQLSYLNLRENRLANKNELTKLMCLESLKTLVVSQNRFGPRSLAAIPSYLTKLLPRLERIDKQKVVRNADDSDAVEWPEEGEEEMQEDE